MSTLWSKTAFFSSPGTIAKEDQTSLPFNIGSLTRHGKSHQKQGLNNQDGINIIVQKELIIGVLCDGCSSGHSNLSSWKSLNHIGSGILAHMVSYLCFENIHKRKNKMNLDRFTNWLTLQTLSRIEAIQKKMRTPESHMDYVNNNLFKTTITGFVIRKNEYFVFHSGDGLISVNDTMFNLESSEGKYLSRSQENQFKIIQKGRTSELNNLLIATDGILESSFHKSVPFKKMCATQHKNSGYSDISPFFHINVLEPFLKKSETNYNWPSDDASFIIINKIKK